MTRFSTACRRSSAGKRFAGTAAPARLKQTGEYLPDDLPRLARLAVLESISMLVNVRADLRGGITGNQLEEEITVLWELFTSVLRVREDISQRRHGERGASKRSCSPSSMPTTGKSRDHSAHCPRRSCVRRPQGAELLGHVNSLMGSMEANAANQCSHPREGTGLLRLAGLNADHGQTWWSGSSAPLGRTVAAAQVVMPL